MATWDSAYCLKRWNHLTGRPQTGDSISDADKYLRLAEAQQDVYGEIAVIAPSVLYNAPTALTSNDGGYTFTFGTDAEGYPVSPMGKVRVYDNLNNVPDAPWRPGVDYSVDDSGNGSLGTPCIRIPNNRTWSGTLYAQWVQQPADISASQAPSLMPAQARILIVLKAAIHYAMEGARNPDLAGLLQAQYDREFRRWMTVLRTQYASGGSRGPLAGTGGFTNWGAAGWAP